MDKTEITLSLDSRKLEALVFYLNKEGATVQGKMDEALCLLYEQTVIEPLREYLDAKAAPARPKRPTKAGQTKVAASQLRPAPAGDKAGGA